MNIRKKGWGVSHPFGCFIVKFLYELTAFRILPSVYSRFYVPFIWLRFFALLFGPPWFNCLSGESFRVFQMSNLTLLACILSIYMFCQCQCFFQYQTLSFQVFLILPGKECFSKLSYPPSISKDPRNRRTIDSPFQKKQGQDSNLQISLPKYYYEIWII